MQIWMALKTGKQQVCCACDFFVGIKAEFRRRADATAARLRAIQRACATTSPYLRMALKTGIRKNRCVGAPAHVPLFCRYQELVEQQEDPNPQVENGRIMGSASLDGAEDRQKTGVLCMPLFCRPLGVLLKSSTCANNRGCCDHLTASSHGAEDRHSTKTGVLAPRHSVCRMQVTSVVRASTECDAVLKGAIPFYAFAH